MLALQILIVIVAIVLIASVMMQDSDNDGVSSLMGGNSDTFFGKNQGGSLQSKMAMVTKVSAGLFVVLALVILIVGKSTGN